MKNKEYLINVFEENKQKINNLMKIYTLTTGMEDKLLNQLKCIEEHNLQLQESLNSILNDFKTISSNLYPNKKI